MPANLDTHGHGGRDALTLTKNAPAMSGRRRTPPSTGKDTHPGNDRARRAACRRRFPRGVNSENARRIADLIRVEPHIRAAIPSQHLCPGKFGPLPRTQAIAPPAGSSDEPDYRALWEKEATDRMNAEKALRTERRKVTCLQKELDDVREANPTIKDALRVFRHWAARRPKPEAIVFGPRRKQKCLDRLAEYSVDDLCHCIDGAYRQPRVVKGTVYDELTSILRDETTVAHYIEVADVHLRPRDRRACDHPAVRYLDRLGCGPGEFDALIDFWRFTCPCCMCVADRLGLAAWFGRGLTGRTLLISCSGDLVFCPVCVSGPGRLVAGLTWLAQTQQPRVTA